MTLSVFLRNPAKCRGPKASPLDFSASKSRAFRGYARQMQAFAERVGLRPHSLRGDSLCILRRCCHPAPGSKTGSHAFDGMASCFAGLVHGGAFWCQRYRAIRSWRWNCSAYEHQRASAAEAVQRIVEIIVVGLVILSRGRCRNSGFQGLQQISKLNGCSHQLLPDDGANRLPQAFVCGCLAIMGIDRRNNQRAVGQAALRVKLTQRPARWLDCPMQARVRI